jgi:hypothetical protein
MGDGRSFDQAVRALDKFIVEHARVRPNVPDPDSPVRLAYERIVSTVDHPYGSPGTS